MLLCEELCDCAGALWWGRGGYLQSEPKVFLEKMLVCYFCIHLCIPPHCCFICGKCPSLSQQMGLASLVGRIRVMHPVGSSAFLDWVPWSMSFLRKARDGSKTSFLPVPLFQFPPFGRTEFDFLSHYYYGLQRTALKLAPRRWKGRGLAVGSLVWRM